VQVVLSDEPRQLKRRLTRFQIEQDRQRMHQDHAQAPTQSKSLRPMPAFSFAKERLDPHPALAG